MPQDKYGSPELDDPTARYERIANAAMDRMETFVDKTIPKIVNRPIGSKAMSREEALQEYQMFRASPELLGMKLTEMMNEMGGMAGRHAFADWVEDMERG